MSLKLVGIVTILASLLDFAVLLLPIDLLDRQWQIGVTTQLVDRGIVPLVGVTLILTGEWIESYVSTAPRRRNLLTDSRFWASLLSTILGIVFLLLAVFHPGNVISVRGDTLQKINDEASQRTAQVENRFNQQRNEIEVLTNNQDQLQQAIESGRLPQEQLVILQQLQRDPEGVNQLLEQRLGADKAQIGAGLQEAQKRVNLEAWESGIRVVISGLMLGIGFSAIGWIGLRRLLALRST
ncbi:MAG: HpsJ family protein [Leptolyngbyaceae cyanobacterium MO_188.B28]|nr:HpsJ family protein [Leptolyngbyaceae cyanobacterium MO_188.B28]